MSSAGGSSFGMIGMLSLMIVVFYVFLMLPDNRRKKKLNDMRNSLRPGDDVTTIGGIMGKVVSVTDDTVVFETGEDQVRMQVAKWAISSSDRAEAQAKKDAESKKSGGLFGGKKTDD